MTFKILNNNYEIIEVTYDIPNVKKIIEHIRDMKNEICKRNETLDYESTKNISSEFISSEAGLIKNNQRFAFIIYQTGLYYQKQTKRPTGLLIARKGSLNDTYIITILCRHESAQKGFGTILLDKLIDKAKKNNIDYIYLESVNNSRLFYKNLGFETDSDKYLHTESEKDDTLTGYLFNISNKQDLKKLKDKITIGGNLDIYTFSYDNTKVVIYNHEESTKSGISEKKELGRLLFNHSIHPILLYVDLEIMEIQTNDNNIKNMLLKIFDNMCYKNYINKSYMLFKDITESKNDYIQLLKSHNYHCYRKKIGSYMYEKLHNKKYIIDRIILKY